MKRPAGWGVCIPKQTIASSTQVQQELDLLRPQSYMNWSSVPFGVETDAVFLPMLWDAGFSRNQLWESLTNDPGQIWLLWNEPERPEQANMTPLEAANLTCEFLSIAQTVDKEFQWAAPGVSVGWDDVDGLGWLTDYMTILRRRRGIMRPAYWHIHSYRSPRKSSFTDGWSKWVEWYNVWGVGAPVILSEVCAEAASIEEQKGMIDLTNILLDTGSITAALWFSTHASRVSNWVNAALTEMRTDGTVALTELGRYWTDTRR